MPDGQRPHDARRSPCPAFISARRSPTATHRVIHVTPESAGWTYVGFDLYRLAPGESARGKTGDREVCLVFVCGRGKAEAGGERFRHARRADESRSRASPGRSTCRPARHGRSTAETDLELAVCSAPGIAGSRPPRVIAPGRPHRHHARQGHQRPLRHQHHPRDATRPTACSSSR